MKRLVLSLTLLLAGCASSVPQIARVQTTLAPAREVTVYVQDAERERALRLRAAEGVEVVEAKLDGDALQVRWKRAGTCPMSELRVPLAELGGAYTLAADGTCALADD